MQHGNGRIVEPFRQIPMIQCASTPPPTACIPHLQQNTGTVASLTSGNRPFVRNLLQVHVTLRIGDSDPGPPEPAPDGEVYIGTYVPDPSLGVDQPHAQLQSNTTVGEFHQAHSGPGFRQYPRSGDCGLAIQARPLMVW